MLSARYIENELFTHHAIREVCVLPVNAQDDESEFHAFIVPMHNSPSSLYELQKELAEHFGGLSLRIVMLHELPKTALGRVSLEALRSLCCTADV